MSAARQNWRATLIHLHRALVDARPAQGRRQDEIAKAIGVSLRSFQRYESGGTDPSIVELMRWAEVLGVPVTLSFEPQTEVLA